MSQVGHSIIKERMKDEIEKHRSYAYTHGMDAAAAILSEMDVPYLVAAPLLIQDDASWRRDGVPEGGLAPEVILRRVVPEPAVGEVREPPLWDEVFAREVAGCGLGLVPQRGGLGLPRLEVL